MFYPNWIHAAFTSLEITKALHTRSLNRLTEEEVNAIDEIYRLWKLAYNAKTIKELAEHFGVGLSMFGKLNPKYKAENSTYVYAALTQTLELCNKHKLQVTFDGDGPIFYDSSPDQLQGPLEPIRQTNPTKSPTMFDRIRYCTVTTDRDRHRIAATCEANARSHIREHYKGEKILRFEWDGEW